MPSKLLFYMRRRGQIFFSTLATLIILASFTRAQDGTSLSGHLLNKNTDLPIKYAHILNKKRMTVANRDGSYAINFNPGDTVLFRHLGYQTKEVVMTKYFINVTDLDIYLTPTIYVIDDISVYPWPSKEGFKRAFMDLNVVDPNLSRAKHNLHLIVFQAQSGYWVEWTYRDNQDYVIENYIRKIEHMGQVSNLFNITAPLALVLSILNGDLRSPNFEDFDSNL